MHVKWSTRVLLWVSVKHGASWESNCPAEWPTLTGDADGGCLAALLHTAWLCTSKQGAALAKA